MAATETCVPLPDPPAPRGGYAAVVIRRGLGVASGQFPIAGGELTYRGRVGAELDVDQARAACRTAALNLVSHIAAATRDFADLDGLLRLDAAVASADDFHDQPSVFDAASSVLTDVPGDRGRHARTALAVPRLPLEAPVELCTTFTITDPPTPGW